MIWQADRVWKGELYLEGELMAWSERQVSRPDLSCRKLFMSLNKMMLQLPMMNNLCVRVCVHALATEKVCEQYCSDRSQRALGRNPPQTHTPPHTDIRIHTHPAMVSPLIIYHYLPQKRGERVTPKTVMGPTLASLTWDSHLMLLIYQRLTHAFWIETILWYVEGPCLISPICQVIQNHT